MRDQRFAAVSPPVCIAPWHGSPVAAVLFHKLAEAGFGPTMYGYFDNGRIEGWFPSAALEPSQMGQVSTPPREEAELPDLRDT